MKISRMGYCSQLLFFICFDFTFFIQFFFLGDIQLPATLHPGVSVVVCPLLSLIQDQVITLNFKFGVPATFLSSQQTASQASAVIRELR